MQGRPRSPDGSIQWRICALLDNCELSTSELALLLESPRPTVHTWARGREPFPRKTKFIKARLAGIEKLCRQAHPKPLLPRASHAERLNKIKSLVEKLNGAVSPVSGDGAARGRQSVRGDIPSRKKQAKTGMGAKSGGTRRSPRKR